MSIESVMPFNHLILCPPLLLLPSIFPSIRVSSSKMALCIKCWKYWSFSFSISPSNDYSRLIYFRLTGLISLLSEGLSRVFSSTTVQRHQFFRAQPSLWSISHIRTWLGKTIALTIWTFVGKVMSLLFTTLSRLVIAFLPGTSSVQFSCSVMSISLQPHEPQHARPPCPSSTPRVYPNLCPLSWWCHLSLSSSVIPFSSSPQHQGLFKWVSSLHQVANILEFQLQHQSFQWTSRTDLL